MVLHFFKILFPSAHCYLILHPVTLLNSLINSIFFFGDFLENFYIDNYINCKEI